MDYDRQDFAPCNTLHFRPDGALVGDVAFFVRGSECHLFYLSKRNDDPPRLPHNQLDHAVSTDLLHWELLPPALLPGEPGTADATGIGGCTIVPDRGIYHMFYAGTVNEVIYHARSSDLVRWHKDSPLRPLVVPDPRWYTPHTVPPEEGRAWRDPFLFRDPAGDRHWLLVTARLSEGAPTERGCVGLAVSEDLEHWEVKPPLYAPHICNAPEVCELFAMDGRYYLFFSHGETFTCRYRVAERWDGPYRRPPDDLLLPPWMYAPRSVCMDGNRYLIPWVADHLSGRDGYQPDYAPVWGGDGFTWGGVLGTPQLMRALPDGRLVLCYPEIVERLLGERLLGPGAWRHAATEGGAWEVSGGSIAGSSDQGLARAMLPAEGGNFRVSCMLTIAGGGAAGLIVRGNERGDAGYYVRVEPGMKSVSLWRYPRPWVVARPLAARTLPDIDFDGPLEVKVLLHRHVLDAYLDGRHLFSAPVHDRREGRFGVFVEDARTRFGELYARELNE